MLDLANTILTLGGLTSQTVGEGTLLNTSAQVGSSLVRQTNVVVEASASTVRVVDQAVGGVTSCHAVTLVAGVTFGSTNELGGAVFFETVVGVFGAQGTTTLLTRLTGTSELGHTNAAAVGQTTTLATGTLRGITVGVTTFGTDTFSIFCVGEVDAGESIETGLAQVITTEFILFEFFLTLWVTDTTTVGQGSTSATTTVGVLFITFSGVAFLGADRAIGGATEAYTKKAFFAAFLGILTTHFVFAQDGVATGDTDTTGRTAIAIGQSGTTSGSTTSIVNPITGRVLLLGTGITVNVTGGARASGQVDAASTLGTEAVGGTQVVDLRLNLANVHSATSGLSFFTLGVWNACTIRIVRFTFVAVARFDTDSAQAAEAFCVITELVAVVAFIARLALGRLRATEGRDAAEQLLVAFFAAGSVTVFVAVGFVTTENTNTIVAGQAVEAVGGAVGGVTVITNTLGSSEDGLEAEGTSAGSNRLATNFAFGTFCSAAARLDTGTGAVCAGDQANIACVTVDLLVGVAGVACFVAKSTSFDGCGTDFELETFQTNADLSTLIIGRTFVQAATGNSSVAFAEGCTNKTLALVTNVGAVALDFAVLTQLNVVGVGLGTVSTSRRTVVFLLGSWLVCVSFRSVFFDRIVVGRTSVVCVGVVGVVVIGCGVRSCTTIVVGGGFVGTTFDWWSSITTSSVNNGCGER